MRRYAFILSAALLLAMPAVAQKPKNFYVPDTISETEEPPKNPTDSAPKDVDKDDGAGKTAVEPDTLPDEVLEKKAQAEKKPDSEKKSEPEKKPESAKKTVGAALGDLLKKKPEGPTEPPLWKPQPRPTLPSQIKARTSADYAPALDPFGLATIFHTRWDFSAFLIDQKEELRFRLNAARARTQRLARAFSALSDEVETRQRNLHSAALAAYLLSRDQQAWAPVVGRNMTEAQMLAVRATMRQDISAMKSALTDYETLRNAVNASTEELAALDKKGLDARNETSPDTPALTIPAANVAYAQTGSVLGERLISVEALKATLAAETLRETSEQRQSIASYAPPPPGAPQPSAATIVAKAPVAPPASVKGQPQGETLQQPERTAAVVIETAVNAPVHAVRDGVVAFAGPFRGYGNMVILEHQKGTFSVYSHLANIQVMERQPLTAGSMLGRAGNLPESGRTGIHFQVRQGKTMVKPQEWLGTSAIDKLIAGK